MNTFNPYTNPIGSALLSSPVFWCGPQSTERKLWNFSHRQEAVDQNPKPGILVGVLTGKHLARAASVTKARGLVGWAGKWDGSQLAGQFSQESKCTYLVRS